MSLSRRWLNRSNFKLKIDMKPKRLRTIIGARSAALVLVASAVVLLTIEVGARPQKRPSPSVRRSHAETAKSAKDSAGNSTTHALVGKPHLKLTDNTAIPIDDAWETSQGIWYRRNGVTYLVECAKVRSIERSPKEPALGSDQSGGVSTPNGANSRTNPVWIYLNGGARVEADDANESAAGVWLKRGNLSVFIDRSRIERIEREEIAGAPTRPGPHRRWSTGRPGLDSLIKQNGARYGVDPYLIFLVMEEESHFNPRVVSPKGARGLMQLMPGTSARFGVRNPFNPSENISGGVRYLKQLLKIYKGRVDLVLASYNAGEGAVAKFGHRVPPYRETRNYVRRIGGRYRTNEIAEANRRPDSQAGSTQE